MYTATIAGEYGNKYHDSREAGRAPVVAAHNIETAISVLVGEQSVDIVRLETGEPVRLWRELVDLRDRVDMHETAASGSEAYAVVVRGSGAQLLTVEVEWQHKAR